MDSNYTGNPNTAHNYNNPNQTSGYPAQGNYSRYGYPSENTRHPGPEDPLEAPMTLKDWRFTFLLLLIPFANIILPFVWAFGNDVNRSKKTFFQAYLIFMLALIIIGIVLIIIFFSLFAFHNITQEYTRKITYYY